MKVKATVTLEEDVIKSIDEYGKKNGISRSGAISVLTSQALQALKMTSTLDNLIGVVNAERIKNASNGTEVNE